MSDVRWISFSMRSHFRRTSRTSTAKKTEDMDKLVTGFKIWKTSFRREVLTCSTHPRQATEWLAETDQANAMQDLDDVRSVFGSNWMSFQTLDSQIARGLNNIMDLEFKRSEELQQKANLPMLTGRQIGFTICAPININDVERRAVSMSDLVGQRQSQKVR